MSKEISVLCMACHNGDHYFCSMQLWCTCRDPQDGDASPQEWDEYARTHTYKEDDDGDLQG